MAVELLKKHVCEHLLQVLVLKLQADRRRVNVRMAQRLLQSPNIPPVADIMYRKGMSECVQVNVPSDRCIVSLDNVSHLPLFEGKTG
jgi:hypothetical protein